MKKLITVVMFIGCLSALWMVGQPQAVAATELTFWEPLSSDVAQAYNSLGDTPLYQELEKRTGVKIKFINVSSADASNQFSLMMASGQLPDMIMYDNWIRYYPGAPGKLLDDKIALPRNDLIEQYAPNFKKVMDEHPEWKKIATTEDGKFWIFPFIRGDESLMVFTGPILRQDFLDQLGLPVPETMDEWYATLTALKTKATYPLSFNKPDKGRNIESGSDFIGAYHMQWDFYVEDGKIKYGQYEPAYKDFLTTWSKWYKEGLIDPDFLTNESAQTDSKILNNQVGAFIGLAGSNIGKYLDAMKGKDPTFNLVGAPHPVLIKGEKPWTGQRDISVQSTGLVITTQCKDPVAAVKGADYAYSPEGHLLFNFGLEGVSFNWVEDFPGFEGQKFPKYTELITSNPNKLTSAATLRIWARSAGYGNFVQDKRYIVQYLKYQQQRDAIQKWMNSDASLHREPPFKMNQQESDEYAQIMSQVDTYMNEMYARFTTGQDALDTFDKYREQLKKMGIEKAIALRQAAYDRYLKK